jgi:signal transduction histidine kinase
MNRSFRPIHTGSDADLAFALVVLASYFTTFSTLQSESTFELLLLIALGVTYIAVGIYGYGYAWRSNKLNYHLAYFIVQMGLGGLIVFLGRGAAFNAMVLLPLAGHSVILLPRHWRLGINIGIVGVYVSALTWALPGLSTMWAGLPLFLAGQIFIIVFTQMAVNEERARKEVEKLANDLGAANQSLREYALQVEELTITRERNRLAREIHDGLGHYLTTIFMQVQAARAIMKADPSKAQDALNTAQNLTQEALLDVRRSVSALRGSLNHGLTLTEEIEKLLKGCESAGIQGEMKVVGSPRPLSPQSQWTVYRSVQEGIHNTCKHAQATQVCVMLDFSQVDQVRLVVQDDGQGAVKVDGGFGLLGMRERVHLLNGEFKVVTAPGEGFKLEVQIPDEKPDNGEG